ncbi:2-oxoacid:acceptor oxidoreductase subunit alpha [Fidelibacter multiformis]|jgi:2-oxoglutarate ferredoxin oxidoreductase subunit alpha|uniref:2-oxoacid:acceptor oxidoreductase subunit alpha n=1 Tax=Fidelibacter multiformis TaxID=3377529 RepID=UPI0037DC802A
MASNNIVIGIAGSGGDGVISAGEILVNAASSDGLFVFMLKSFGAQIRGGESSVRVRMSSEPVATQGDKLDILVVLSWKDYLKFQSEMLLEDHVVILSDSEDSFSEENIPIPADKLKNWYKVPFNQLATNAAGTSLAKNIAMLGVISELFNLPKTALEKSVKKKFSSKRDDVIEKNLNALKAGRDYVKKEIEKKDSVLFEYTPGDPRIVMEGNEATAFGALYAGVEFYAGYPITPSTEIMHWLSVYLPRYNGVVIQMEDELASINAVVGASFAGRKAMTATSGPGVSLMSEGIGLAGMAELPIVVINVQRGGPSTGIPTKTEQADLMQAIWGSHGDAPRVVIAPSDVEDCFDCTVLAFYIAEKYQLPVIVLSDAFIGHRKESINPNRFRDLKYGFKKINRRITPTEKELEDYHRFKITKNGISPVTWPGMEKGMYQAAGIEHNEKGFPSSDVSVHSRMTKKRWEKFREIKREFSFERFYGPDDAELGVIAWGSTKGAVKEAVARANANGIKVQAIIPQILYPFLIQPFHDFLRHKKRVIFVEMAYAGAFRRYLRGFVRFGDFGVETVSYRQTGGAPFTVGQIYDKIVEEYEKKDA